MLRIAVKLFQIVFVVTWICDLFSPLEVQAQWPYSTNPDDYDFGWFPVGTYSNDSVPVCAFCVNGFEYDPAYLNEPISDLSNGPFWNHTVGIYRCDGVQMNEMWAYHEPSTSIIFANFTNILCIDAVAWDSLGLLKLRPCNASAVTQRWKRDGNRVISGLVGANGEPLFMVAGTPNHTADPTSHLYEFILNISSSLPSPSNSGVSDDYLYTDNFTFLSTKDLVDKSTNTFTTEALILLGNTAPDHIVNGGFERSTIQAGTSISWSDWNPPVPSYFALCGWVIYGAIDYVKSGLVQPAEGEACVHLNTNSDKPYASTISQTFRTEMGNDYLISFYLNGFPPHLKIALRPTWRCSATYTEARLQVGVSNSTSTEAEKDSGPLSNGSSLQQNFTLSVANSSSVNAGALWQLHTMRFKASTNVTVISFSSLNFNDSCGPLIDEVTVSALQLHS